VSLSQALHLTLVIQLIQCADCRSFSLYTSTTETLQREPSNLEWAEACNLSLEQLYTYYALATTARQRLVQHNFRLVDFWARRLIEHTNGGKFISYYELVTEGVIGLTKAAAQYDGRGAFIKFAQHYVRNELYRGMTRLRPGSFLSHKTVMLSVRAHKARERLQETYQRKPTDQEVATELKVSVRTLREELDTAALKKTIISASAKISGGAEDALENAKTYLDMLANSDKSIFTADTLQWKIGKN
jgi:DNA-directed RNA polymerase specialized sigma subunit